MRILGRRPRLRLLILSLLLVPTVLLAHARLRRSAPAAGQALSAPPTAIRLWFSEAPQLAFTHLRLLGRDSSEVALGPEASEPDMAVSVAIRQPLAAGTYTVVWRTAAADGHPSNGRFQFTVAPPPAATAPPGATVPESAGGRTQPPDGHLLVGATEGANEALSVDEYTAVRWMEFIALLTVIGVLVFQFAVLGALRRRGEPTGDAVDAARRLGLGALVLLAFAALSRLYSELLLLTGGQRPVDAAALSVLLRSSAWGYGWLVGAGGIVVVGAGLLLAKRRFGGAWEMAAVGGLALALSPALTGHAIASPDRPALAVVADALHVVAAAGWLGTLLLVVLAGIPAVLRRHEDTRATGIVALIGAFNPVALSCAAIVVVTGAVSAWLRLESLPALWQSMYGKILLLKLGALACALVIGAYNWLRLTPSLGDDQSPRRVRRSATLELLVGVVVVAVTAVLVATATPATRASAAVPVAVRSR